MNRHDQERQRNRGRVWLNAADLPPAARRKRYAEELRKQQYYQRRNKQACTSHTKTRLARLQALGIDIQHIKSCLPDTTEP